MNFLSAYVQQAQALGALISKNYITEGKLLLDGFLFLHFRVVGMASGRLNFREKRGEEGSKV